MASEVLAYSPWPEGSANLVADARKPPRIAPTVYVPKTYVIRSLHGAVAEIHVNGNDVVKNSILQRNCTINVICRRRHN